MKYALIGKSIAHSRSPELYREIIAEDIEYDLIDVPTEANLPPLADLARLYDGINITSPYKRSYVSSVIIQEPEVRELGAINTIAFTDKGWFGTNTDLHAVEYILKKFTDQFPKLHFIVLGSGVMSNLTSIVARNLRLSHQVLDRKNGLVPDLDLRPFLKIGHQNVVINACSRDFIFSGEISESTIFWDYNYDLIPHQNTLPSKAALYLDGQDMLLIQAKAAAKFWLTNKH
jgi:shikimate dehydrogenase